MVIYENLYDNVKKDMDSCHKVIGEIRRNILVDIMTYIKNNFDIKVKMKGYKYKKFIDIYKYNFKRKQIQITLNDSCDKIVLDIYKRGRFMESNEINFNINVLYDDNIVDVFDCKNVLYDEIVDFFDYTIVK